MVFTKSRVRCDKLYDEILELDEDLADYVEKNIAKHIEKFCISSTPNFFQGPSITTSPLEKLNDMLKD